MAAPVVESFSTVNFASTDPAPAKPTGLAEGDLMLAFILTGSTSGNTVNTVPTPSGWTLKLHAFHDSTADTHRVYVFWKIADSSDVAASTFSFNCDNTDAENAAVLCRISGHAASNPLDTGVYGSNGSGANPTVNISNGIVRTTDTLMFMVWLTTNVSAGTQAFSNYTVNGITNPSWTEIFDQDNNSAEPVGAVAHAVSGAVGTVTSIEVDEADGDESNFIGIFVTLPPATPVTVNLDVLTIGAVVQEPALAGKASVTIDALSIGAAVQEPDTTQPTPKWSNTDKSDTNPSISNTAKS